MAYCFFILKYEQHLHYASYDLQGREYLSPCQPFSSFSEERGNVTLLELHDFFDFFTPGSIIILCNLKKL